MRSRWFIVALVLFGLHSFADAAPTELLVNPSNEEPLVGGEIPGWTEVVGTLWKQRSMNPTALDGTHYFYADDGASAELAQLVDVSAYATKIDDGLQVFNFAGHVSAFDQEPPDQSRIVVEYLDDMGVVLEQFDSGNISSVGTWQAVSDSRTAPVGTRSINVRLISTRRASINNDGYYDALSLTTEELGDCRDQVQVRKFSARRPSGGLTAKLSPDGSLLRLETERNNKPGITFTANVRIRNGPLPVDSIKIRYIQNLTNLAGAADYDPNPDLIYSTGGATLPLLDRSLSSGMDSFFPFYQVGFNETNKTGSRRTVTANDSPFTVLPVAQLGPSRQLKKTDLTGDLTMFLGCYDTEDPDSTFRTLATLNWTVRYSGTFIPGPPAQFRVASDAGISVQPSVPGGGSPVQSPPEANTAVTVVDGPP